MIKVAGAVQLKVVQAPLFCIEEGPGVEVLLWSTCVKCTKIVIKINFFSDGTDDEEEAREGEPPLRKLKPDEGGFVREEEPKKAGDDEEDGQVSCSIKCGSKNCFSHHSFNGIIPQVCPVCFDAWSNSGSHRVVSLKCGHLFGQSCIERWVHSGGKGARCPQCNEAAQKKDIRPIYVRNLKVHIYCINITNIW